MPGLSSQLKYDIQTTLRDRSTPDAAVYLQLKELEVPIEKLRPLVACMAHHHYSLYGHSGRACVETSCLL
jgi:hypothetical protein